MSRKRDEVLDQVSRLTAENAMLKEKWPTPKREPLSDIRCPYPEETRGEYRDGFTDGMLHAEKAHGIGSDDA